jgi:hypothetical protein
MEGNDLDNGKHLDTSILYSIMNLHFMRIGRRAAILVKMVQRKAHDEGSFDQAE